MERKEKVMELDSNENIHVLAEHPTSLSSVIPSLNPSQTRQPSFQSFINAVDKVFIFHSGIKHMEIKYYHKS